jgi:hypothetical protein
MMIRSITGVFLAACLGLHEGCSRGPVAAGSSGTGNAFVAGAVYDDAGNPLAGKTVSLRGILITPAGDSTFEKRSAQSASDGAYRFDGLFAGKYAVYCGDQSGGRFALIQKITLPDDSASWTADLVLRRPLVVKGRVVAPAASYLQAMQISIPGLGTVVHPDSQGNYSIPSAPRSACDICFLSGPNAGFLAIDQSAAARDTAFVNDVRFATTLPEAQGVETYYPGSMTGSFIVVPVEQQAKALLFDNFEKPLIGGVAHNAIYDILPVPGDAGSGQWVVRPNSDGHSVTPVVFPAGFDSGIVSEGAFRGKSLRIFISFNTGRPPTGGIGVDICTPRVYYDLSKMTEFGFYAKGSGRHRVVFHTDTVENGEGEFIYEFTIPTDWQRISIKNTDLAPKPGTQTEARGVTWQRASRGVTSISFFALTDNTLYMDDLYLFGVSATDIVKTSPGNQMP